MRERSTQIHHSGMTVDELLAVLPSDNLQPSEVVRAFANYAVTRRTTVQSAVESLLLSTARVSWQVVRYTDAAANLAPFKQVHISLNGTYLVFI